MQLILHRFDLTLRHTFTITHESRDIQPTLIVELRDGAYSGFGEATETPYYGITIEKLVNQLEAVRPFIEEYPLENPKDFWQENTSKLLDSHPFALCALDCAAWDLWAKKRGQKLYEAWGLNPSKNVITDYTIGMDTIEKMVEKMKETPFPLYKIKLGSDQDIEIVTELRKHTDAVFRVDANTAWSASQTIDFAPKLKE
ncbi:MAG: dipeptide epimerase, partial [Bacteroidota bacterium]